MYLEELHQDACKTPRYSRNSRLAMKSSAKRPNKINNRSQQCNSPKAQCIVQNQEERLKKLQHQICRSFWDSSFRCIHLKNMAMLDQLAFFAAVQKLCPLMAIWMYAFLIEHECSTPQPRHHVQAGGHMRFNLMYYCTADVASCSRT